jgi:hypothetical protein
MPGPKVDKLKLHRLLRQGKLWIILPNPLLNGVSDEIILWFVGYSAGYAIKNKKKGVTFIVTP